MVGDPEEAARALVAALFGHERWAAHDTELVAMVLAYGEQCRREGAADARASAPCLVAHEGETTYECDATRPCRVCRWRIDTEETTPDEKARERLNLYESRADECGDRLVLKVTATEAMDILREYGEQCRIEERNRIRFLLCSGCEDGQPLHWDDEQAEWRHEEWYCGVPTHLMDSLTEGCRDPEYCGRDNYHCGCRHPIADAEDGASGPEEKERASTPASREMIENAIREYGEQCRLDERERCAAIADDLGDDMAMTWGERGQAFRIAKRIRCRANTEETGRGE